MARFKHCFSKNKAMNNENKKDERSGIEQGNENMNKSGAQWLDENIEQPNEFENLPTPEGGHVAAGNKDAHTERDINLLSARGEEQDANRTNNLESARSGNANLVNQKPSNVHQTDVGEQETSINKHAIKGNEKDADSSAEMSDLPEDAESEAAEKIEGKEGESLEPKEK